MAYLNDLRRLLMLALMTASMAASAHELQVDVAGVLNNDERGAVSNIVRDIQVAPGAVVTGFAWDVNLTSHPGSYLSEMQLTFSDMAGNGVTFTPGDGDEFDGSMAYSGFQDLSAIGQAFQVGADGILRLEFHDSFKDLGFDEPEGVWNFGTLTFTVSAVPEPRSYALILGAMVFLGTAARKRSI